MAAERVDQYQTIDAPVPGANYTVLQGINDQGDVSRIYHDVNQFRHGFVLTRSGKFITIDVPGAINTRLAGISDNGNVAGYYNTAGGDLEGFYVLKAVP
jgi:hypothetical protein